MLSWAAAPARADIGASNFKQPDFGSKGPGPAYRLLMTFGQADDLVYEFATNSIATPGRPTQRKRGGVPIETSDAFLTSRLYWTAKCRVPWNFPLAHLRKHLQRPEVLNALVLRGVKALDGALADSNTVVVVSISRLTNSGWTRDRTKLQDAIMSLQTRALYRPDESACPKIDYYRPDRE